MPVTESSKIAHKIIRSGQTININQAAVYDMIEYLGPCHRNRVIEAMQQAEKKKLRSKRRIVPWDKCNCWPRITELLAMRLVINMGLYRWTGMGLPKSFNFIRVIGDNNTVPPGWEKVEQKNPKDKPPVAKKTFKQRTAEQAFVKVGQVFAKAGVSASEAGRQLANHKHRKAKIESQKQMQLFKGK